MADGREVVSHEVLPGELSTFRAVGATGFGLGAAGGVALWLTQPEIGSGGVAVLTTAGPHGSRPPCHRPRAQAP